MKEESTRSYFAGACDMDSNSSVDGIGQSIQNLGPNVQLITLNTEGEYSVPRCKPPPNQSSPKTPLRDLVHQGFSLFQRISLLAFGLVMREILR